MTQIMAILNATPDSYFDKSRASSIEEALMLARKFELEGADYIDIGGMSTKPGTPAVSEEEEIKRVIPLIEALKREIKTPLSIDTYRYKVAKRALDAGVQFINDITGFKDPKMQELAAQSALPVCLMHMQGNSMTMQKKPIYPNGVMEEIYSFFEKRLEELYKRGIKREQIYLDPGIGFGKTLDHNLKILQDLDKLRGLNHPLLLGTSRKTFIRLLTQTEPETALYGTLGVNSLLILKDVEILRVHDVRAHKDLITVLDALRGQKVRA